MNFDELKNPELQEKLMACKTAEDLVALAEAEGVELSDDQLESISGGIWLCDDHTCGGYRHYVHC